MALALVCAACTGDVKPGLPPDAGEDLFAPQDAGFEASRDAGATASLDAGRGREAGSDLSDDEDAAAEETTRDAEAPSEGEPGTAEPGSGDVNSTDRTKFMGSPRCEAGGFLLCDDFESEEAGGGPDMTMWTNAYGYMPTVDTQRAARGLKSLHFQRKSGEPGLIEAQMFPGRNNGLFGRMFVWLEQIPTSTNAHWTIAAAGAGSFEVRVDGQPDQSRGGENSLGLGSVGTDGQGDFDWHTPGKEPLSRARTKDWICIEWQFKGDTSEARLWVDGVVQLQLTPTDYQEGEQDRNRPWAFPMLEKLQIGAWTYQANATPDTLDLWIDEVAVDDERIGCVR